MRRFLLLGALLISSIVMSFAQPYAPDANEDNAVDKPVLTIGCLSDLHNELGLISGNVSNVRLRGTIGNTVKRMHEDEDVDLICLGGDYTSDVTVAKENWQRVKDLMRQTLRGAFKDYRTYRPVIFVTGNHDYEVANFDNIPKDYNAAYYQDIMEEDIGELNADDAYYEVPDNGSSEAPTLLAAYHYQIKDFDFVMLNCGLYFFRNAWDYTYSLGSVQWVADKLAQIYADDPDKTVFFLMHIPFGDSNSISSVSKGMKDCEATRLLKATLSKYPNLIMLYGHDHGTNSAFIREKTSQRVTRYNTGGSVISSFDATHVDEPIPGQDPTTGEEDAESPVKGWLRADANGEYLSYSSTTNLEVTDEPMEATIDKIDGSNGLFTIQLGDSYVYCGSSATFSGNKDVTDYSSAFLYKVVTTGTGTGNSYEGTRVTKLSEVTPGTKLIVVCRASKDRHYYALLPQNTSSSASQSNRMVSTLVSEGTPRQTISIAYGDFPSPVWTLTNGNGDGDTPTSTLPLDICIKNVANGRYLGVDANNLNTLNEATTSQFYEQNGSLYLKIANTGRDLHIGTGGRFSRGDASSLTLYEVTDPNATGIITCTAAALPKTGHTYLITAVKDNMTYAMSNEVYNAGQGDEQRLSSQAVTVTDGKATIGADKNYMWTLTEKPQTGDDKGDDGDGSFFSSFMGSMRYYNNSIEGDVSVSNSKIVQALMVYVYPDRITLKMKNYGQSGTFNGITINPDLAAYTVYRQVRNSKGALTTGIKEVGQAATTLHTDGNSQPIYDLQGRLVEQPTHGIYISNGRKVVY